MSQQPAPLFQTGPLSPKSDVVTGTTATEVRFRLALGCPPLSCVEVLHHFGGPTPSGLSHGPVPNPQDRSFNLGHRQSFVSFRLPRVWVYHLARR